MLAAASQRRAPGKCLAQDFLPPKKTTQTHFILRFFPLAVNVLITSCIKHI